MGEGMKEGEMERRGWIKGGLDGRRKGGERGWTEWMRVEGSSKRWKKGKYS